MQQQQITHQEFSKYLEKRNDFQQSSIKNMHLYQMQQRQKNELLDKKLNDLKTDNLLIDEEKVKKIFNNIDRLKSLKNLTNIYGGIKNNMVNAIKLDNLNNLASIIDDGGELSMKLQKLKNNKKDMTQELMAQLDNNEINMKQFISKEQMKDRKHLNMACQYEIPIEQEELLRKEELLETQEKNLLEEMVLQEKQQLIEVQKQRKQIQKELEGIKYNIFSNLKEISEMEKNFELNLIILKEDINQKDETQRIQFQQLLNNKISSMMNQNPSSTHNLDLIQILSSRIQDQGSQITKEIYKELCEKYDIKAQIATFETYERNRERQIKKKAKEQKKNKIIHKQGEQDIDQQIADFQKIKSIEQDFIVPLDDKNLKLIVQEIKKEEQQIKQIQIKNRFSFSKQKIFLMRFNSDKKFANLTVEEQLNHILSTKIITDEEKQNVLSDYLDTNRSLLQKEDIKKIQNLIKIPLQDFLAVVNTKIQLKNLRSMVQKVTRIKILPSVVKVKANSKFKESHKENFISQTKLKYQEEIDSFLDSWRIKEYLIMKCLTSSQNIKRIEWFKKTIRDMFSQYFHYERLKNKLIQEKIILEKYMKDEKLKQQQEKQKLLTQSTGSTTQGEFRIKLKKKVNNRYQETEISQTQRVPNNKKLNPFESFYAELQSFRQTRKNTIPESTNSMNSTGFNQSLKKSFFSNISQNQNLKTQQ